MLNAILSGARKSAHSFRQITKAADGGFNLADAFEVRQLIQPRREITCQFQMPLDRPGIATFAHELERHPKLQRVEAPRTHLAITKEVVLDVGAATIFAEVLWRDVETIAQNVAAVAHQRRAA